MKKITQREMVWKLGRFKLLAQITTGFKPGRLPGKGISSYWRFKPFYFAWGLRNQTGCLLRNFHVKFIHLEVVPIRIRIFATPKDVWEHWQQLKRKAGRK